MRRSLLALLLAFSTGAPLLARADEVDTLGGKAVEIEAKVRELGSDVKPAHEARGPEYADRRLIDAQVLYELKNYEAASIILLDIVDKDEYKSSPAYPEALYFLADSLFQKRDFLSSRRYFEKIVEEGPSTKRYQEALQRLIELSLYTGDYTPVDGYIAKLEQMPPGNQLPSVPYVKGKYFYFRQRYDDALAAFRAIPPGHVYWFHSQYFIGAALVAENKLVDAISVFDGILKVEPKTDSQKRITELAHMALGRIYYNRGQFTNANLEYGKINQKSELFPDALFEQAWVAIKAKEYKRAYHALDLLLTAKPDDPQVPEVKLLIGNLLIRETEWAKATDQFTKTRDEFEPIHKQLQQILAQQQDPNAYFQQLIGKNLGKFDVATYLPPIAIKWAKAEPDVQHVIDLVSDVADLKKSLDESDEIVSRLEKAVDGPQKINIFPELAHARTKALEAGNELDDVRKKLLEKERDLLAPVAGSERAQLDELARQRADLERQLAAMPRSAESYEERLKKAKAQFDAIDKQASEVYVLLQNYHAERVAIELYAQKTMKGIDPDKRAQFEKEAADVTATEDELRKTYEQLRRDLDDAIQSVGVDDSQMQQEAQVKKQLDDVMNREHEMSAAVRARLTGPDRTKVDQIESILSRCDGITRQLADFDQKIDGEVDDRLKEIKVAIAEEKAHVAEYEKALSGYQGETVEVGGGITSQSFQAIADRFYQIVVRSDVGIIDVAWALKDNKTQEDARLVREEKRELKLLDDEFKEVLKE